MVENIKGIMAIPSSEGYQSRDQSIDYEQTPILYAPCLKVIVAYLLYLLRRQYHRHQNHESKGYYDRPSYPTCGRASAPPSIFKGYGEERPCYHEKEVYRHE